MPRWDDGYTEDHGRRPSRQSANNRDVEPHDGQGSEDEEAPVRRSQGTGAHPQKPVSTLSIPFHILLTHMPHAD